MHTACIQGADDLINYWQNSVNIWLNYIPCPSSRKIIGTFA